jgi:hypothetical protein
MAITAVFRKDPPGLLEKDKHDGFDTRDGFTSYQMVPLNNPSQSRAPGSRPFLVRISGGTVQIEAKNATVAEISIAGFPPSKFQILKSPAQSDLPFTIHAVREGRTTIFALDDNRTILDRMNVSVKTELQLTYNLIRLGDSLRETLRTMDQLRSIMTTVEDVYLTQANVKLIRRNEVEAAQFRIKKDLKDPIDVSVPPPISLRPNLRVLLRQRLGELGLVGEKLNLISSWSLTGIDGSLGGFTPDLGTTCICEVKGNELIEASSYAHEMGHALGLRHETHNLQEMMNDKGVNSFRMNQADINALNQSGLNEPP